MPAKITIANYLQRLDERNKKYPIIFLHEKSSFKGMHKPATFICEYDHIFVSISRNVIQGHGCPMCSRRAKYTQERLFETLSKTPYMFVDFSEYETVNTKMHFQCKKGHVFRAQLKGVISNTHGCPVCSKKLRVTKDNVSELVRERSEYECINPEEFIHREKNNLKFQCKKKHIFINSFRAITSAGTLCPICYPSNCSKKALDWINSIRIKENIIIQDHIHGGEFGIPKTNYRADGYCKETNTIYEFYGTNFHGDLRYLKPIDYPSPFMLDKTAQELYDYTMERERKILELGYNLVTIWEKDWDNLQ